MDRKDHGPDLRRLRLDTGSPSSSSSTPYTSSPYDDASTTHEISRPGTTYHHDASISSTVSQSDLMNATPADRNDEEAMHESAISDMSLDAGAKHTSEVDAPTQASRPRNMSVSFSSHATLDNGHAHFLEEPLPKPRRQRTRGESLSQITQDPTSPATPASQASPRINPFTGEIARRRTRRGDSVRSIGAQDGLTISESTSSLYPSRVDGLRTPISPSGSFLLSPRTGPVMVASPAVSPILAAEPWPMQRSGSLRSSRADRQSSLRESSRRSSRLSGSTSMSPATNFLSKWRSESISSSAPKQDDEGQTFGLENEYVIGQQIGYGGFSVVKEIFSISDNGQRTRRAVKIVRKAIPDTSDTENDRHQQQIEHEVGIWRCLQHNNILALHAVYETDYATFCVMDLVNGGSLFDLIRQSRKTEKKGLGEQLAKTYAHQLALAIRYLHEDVRVIHRDIKLENCLVDFIGQDTQTEGGTLKLCDFGLADFFNDMSSSVDSLGSVGSGVQASSEFAGTLQYAAPESLNNKNHLLQPASDIWAFGICVYALLTGDLPFKHSLPGKLVELISEGQWDEDAIRKAVELQSDFEAVKDLLTGCLEVDSKLRWSISDVMECSWFADIQDLSASAGDWEMLSSPAAS